MSLQKRISNWMVRYGQGAPSQPTIPSFEVRRLRAKLQLEETLELIIKGLGIDGVQSFNRNHAVDLKEILETIKSPDASFFPTYQGPCMKETRDGIADVQVVNLGTAVAFGVDADADTNEAMDSNDTKMWTDDEIRPSMNGLTDDFFQIGSEVVTDCGNRARKVSNETRCWLVRDRDGKVVKSPSYTKPNFNG